MDGKNITISPDSLLLGEITMLVKKAKESRNEGSDILRRVSNKNGTIKALTFDIEKDLIFSIQLSKML